MSATSHPIWRLRTWPAQAITPAPVSAERIPSLDGLRGISICLILFGHLIGTSHFPASHLLKHFAGIGILGVQAFFVLSGFLITNLLLHEKKRTGSISLRHFYLRRVIRIVPPFLALVVLVALARAVGLLEVNLGSPTTGFLYAVSLIQFYLLWPLILKYFRNGDCIRIAVGVAVLVPVLRCLIIYFHRGGNSLVSVLAPQSGDLLAVGCLAALSLQNIRGSDFCLWLLRSPIYLFFLPSVVLVNALGQQSDLVPAWLALPFGQSFIALATAIVVVRVTIYPWDAFGRLLNWSPVVGLGALSYSIYLWQQAFLNHEGHTPWNGFPLNVVLALAVAGVSYLTLERPFLSLRRRRFA